MSEYDTYLTFIAEQGWQRDDVSCDLENSIRATLRLGETPNVSKAFRASDGRIYGKWN